VDSGSATYRQSSRAIPGAYHEIWWYLSFYPALLCLYAGGNSSIAAKKFDTLSALCWKPIVQRSPRGEGIPIITIANCEGLLNREEGRLLYEPEQRLKTPVSDYLFGILRAHLSNLLLDDAEYESAFVGFEYFVSLMLFHYQLKTRPDWPSYAPVGSYIWRERHSRNNTIDRLRREAEEQGASWPPLMAGLFEGSPQVFKSIVEAFHSSSGFQHAAYL
jgi:hypothetical protein